MGRLLQIRVSAWTYSEDDVEKAWPGLWALAWADPNVIPKKGVLELAQAIFDGVRSGIIAKEPREALLEKAEAAEELRFQIQDALAARDPQAADRLSYQLEDCLDALEDIAGKF